jgi:cytoskeletal protein CcmA (bactofilin family)
MKKTDVDIQMLGPQAVLEGKLVFEGTLFLNSHLKGSIESRSGEIVVGEDAVIHADVFVQAATIKGEIKGAISATERIEIHPPARVFGDLDAPTVRIDAGVIFEGNCTIKAKDNAASQTNQVLSTKAQKTEKLMKSSLKPQAPFGYTKNNKLDPASENAVKVSSDQSR